MVFQEENIGVKMIFQTTTIKGDLPVDVFAKRVIVKDIFKHRHQEMYNKMQPILSQS